MRTYLFQRDERKLYYYIYLFSLFALVLLWLAIGLWILPVLSIFLLLIGVFERNVPFMLGSLAVIIASVVVVIIRG